CHPRNPHSFPHDALPILETGGPSQLWRLAYPSGAVTRLTNDLGSYVDVSITAARDSLVTTKTDRRVAIWVSDGSGANAKEVVPRSEEHTSELQSLRHLVC